jgi:hypothetical protein
MNHRMTIAQLRSNGGDFLGTGFFIAANRVVTCRHVIEKHVDNKIVPTLKVHWLGEERTVSKFLFHESRDAAIIDVSYPFSIEPTIFKWAGFTASEGRRVIISGYSKPEVYELEQLVRFIRGYSPDYDLCVVDHPVDPGFSGSPAIVDDLLVGLTVATDPSRTLLIPVTALASFRPAGSNDFTEDCVLDVGAIIPVPEWGSPAEVKFTVTNTGKDICKISSICLHIENRRKIVEPHHFLPGAIVEEYELNVHLTPDRDRYELLNAPHILKPGETDGFRVKIDSDDGWEYTISITISINVIGAKVNRQLLIGPIDLTFRLRSTISLLEAIREAKRSREVS